MFRRYVTTFVLLLRISTETKVILVQDNAPIHMYTLTKRWLSVNSFTILDWPAKSPNLKSIENHCGTLTRQVYDGAKQYTNVEVHTFCDERVGMS